MVIKEVTSQSPGLEQCSIDGEKDRVSVDHSIGMRNKEQQRNWAKERRQRDDNKALVGCRDCQG